MLTLQNIHQLQTQTEYIILDAYIERKVIEKALFEIYQSVQTGKQHIPIFSNFLHESEYLMVFYMLKELEYRYSVDQHYELAKTTAKFADDLLVHGSVESIPDNLLNEAYTENSYGSYMRDIYQYFKNAALTFYDDSTLREMNLEIVPEYFRKDQFERRINKIRAPQTEVW